MASDEIWKDVDGYESRYQVSNFGNVRSLKRLKRHNTSATGFITVDGKMLKPFKTKKGYLKVDLSGLYGGRKSKSVHQLVATAFIENPNNYDQVNHIDGDKTNNHVSNLEWCNNSHNQLHAYKHGLNIRSEKAGKAKIPVVKIDKTTNEIIESYPSISEAAKANGIKKPSNISLVCRNKRKTCNGYKWAYKGGDANDVK